ncbi:MAG: ferritin-like domain-containing protein [Bacteroidetes bacterium]|nr:MAG: ferritin-like domain-containing protein [Bacteroidota bacterium]
MKQSKNTSTSNNGNGFSEKNGHSNSPLEKFFVNELKDIYNAEQQLIQALPEMKKAATTEELEDAFEHHLKQTERHIKRLEKVFKMIGKGAIGKKCDAMEGLIREGKAVINDTKEGSMTRDAALIIGAQKIEHYEIASYGGLVQLAITMGLNKAADILEKTLNEEEETDRYLTEIAETRINMEAEDEGEYSWSKKENEIESADESL